MMTTIKNATLNFLSKFWEILQTVIAWFIAVSVTRFDNLGPGMISLLKRENSREEKTKILTYTIKNIVVFGLISYMANEILNLNITQKVILNLFFVAVGLAVFFFVTGVEKTFKISNLVSCVNISLRLGFAFKVLMVGISLIASIPILGPASLGIFVIINLPKVLKEELKRFF